MCGPRELPTAGHNDRTELSITIRIAGTNRKSRAKSVVGPFEFQAGLTVPGEMLLYEHGEEEKKQTS